MQLSKIRCEEEMKETKKVTEGEKELREKEKVKEGVKALKICYNKKVCLRRKLCEIDEHFNGLGDKQSSWYVSNSLYSASEGIPTQESESCELYVSQNQ